MEQTKKYYDGKNDPEDLRQNQIRSRNKQAHRHPAKHFGQSNLPPEYQLDLDEVHKDYKFSPENNSMNKRHLITQQFGKYPNSSTSRPIATDRLAHKFHQIKCQKYPSKHGNYDFICIDPKTPYETIVCIDCYKDNPHKMRYFQEHPDQFVRFNQFFDQCQNPHISDRNYRKLEGLKDFENRFEQLLGNWNAEEAREVKKFKSFYRNLENAFIDKVQYYLRKTFVKMIDQVKDSWGQSRVKIEDVYSTTQNLTKFLNDGHLRDLETFIRESKESKRGFNKLNRKVEQLVGLNFDLDYLVKDFSK